jgi:hypothetical protein
VETSPTIWLNFQGPGVWFVFIGANITREERMRQSFIITI